MSEKRYKVVNTTVKKPRMEGGKDLRKMIEKVGHSVQFRDENNKLTVLPPGRGTIVTKVDGGLLGLKRAGMVSIEEIENMATALKEHTLDKKDEKVQRKKAAKKKKKTSRKASSVEMGKDTHGKDASAEANEGYEGAKNPDGAGNHRVVAPSKKKKKKKSTRQRKVLEEGDLLPEKDAE
jgi:hypothetical protein